MHIRRSARLLIINPSRQVMLFRFEHSHDALAGRSYWATPGGGVEDGEFANRVQGCSGGMAVRQGYKQKSNGEKPDVG